MSDNTPLFGLNLGPSAESLLRIEHPSSGSKLTANWTDDLTGESKDRKASGYLEMLPGEQLFSIAEDYLGANDLKNLTQVSTFFRTRLQPYVDSMFNDRFFPDGKQTILHLYVEKGWKIRVAQILQTLDNAGYLFDNLGETVMHIAARTGNSEIVAMFLEDSGIVSSINDCNHVGETPLMVAIRGRHESVVRQIVEQAPDLEYYADDENHCALHYLTKTATPIPLTLLRYLIEAGANPKAIDKFKRTCLHWAADHNHVEVISALMKNSDARTFKDARDISGRTALWIASHLGFVETVKVLMDAGCDPSIGCEKGLNPMSTASWMAKVEVLELFCKIKRSRDTINVPNRKGQRPIMRAIKMGDLKTVKTLLNADCKVTETMWLVAVEKYRFAIANLLEARLREKGWKPPFSPKTENTVMAARCSGRFLAQIQ